MTSVNLIIDIGNTAAKLVAFDGNTLMEEVRTSSERLEGLPAFAEKYPFSQGIVASVVTLSATAKTALQNVKCPLIRFDANTPIPLRNDYGSPATLGADRLAAAIGAYMQQPHHNLLIIDAGTCITYEFVSKDGSYKGGSISPGLHMRFRALHTFTSRLPLIHPEGALPEIGTDTETSIRTGVIRGIQLEIEGQIRSFLRKYPDLLVFLTGGDAFDFENTIKSRIFADKYIVPKGLNYILAYNNEKH